ncbi:MAG: RNA polymerase factor sigma-54 [Kiritimatiellae bacterium]|nr:RNA polymerase factor sigma-54 [Kiritimatiellia bacterium]
MKLTFGLNQSAELSQQLNLAPQLLSWLRLLQLPTQDLHVMIRQELETNPALEVHVEAGGDTESERGESGPEDGGMEPSGPVESSVESSLEEKLKFLQEIDESWTSDPANAPRRNRSDADAEEKHRFVMDRIVARPSLQEHLLRQLPVAKLSERDEELARLVIGSIDDRGYLATPLTELAGLAGTSDTHLEAVLREVQSFDPPGIGARDLRECLLLQLQDLQDPDALPVRIVRDYFEALANRQYEKMARVLNVSEEHLLEAVEHITALNPHPGTTFSAGEVCYVTPDVVVRALDGEYHVELNDEYIPRLRISASCRRILESGTISAEDLAYIRNKIRKATFIIQGINQRQETLRKVAQEIVRTQRHFFERDDTELKPLTMARVAAIIGVHETTVSRALANKYIETPRGLFNMKYFFRPGYKCNDGSALTPNAVKNMIVEFVEAEDKAAPLTDLQITDLFKQKGLKIARRTIAKYREELGIDSSKQRGPGGEENPPIAFPEPVGASLAYS